MGLKKLILIFGCFVLCSNWVFADYCTQSYTCTKTCSTLSNSTTECGLFGWGLISSWGHCTTYRTVYRACPDTCYKRTCCPGYTGSTCSTPLCHGSRHCSNRGMCVAPDRCTCPSGFSQPLCDDIDECYGGSNDCQDECVNTYGSYHCMCRNGYELGVDQRSCYDANECQANNGGCSQVCTNTEGSYKCTCRIGFKLGPDGKACVDANECQANNGGCSQVCTNTEGSYKCTCRIGFKLGPDGKACVDANECQANNGGCSQVCTNTEGSYKCTCRIGFKLGPDGKSCVDIDNCENNTCQHNGTCVDGINSFTCMCEPGYTDQLCQTDVDECQDKNGGCQDICTNTNGSYECICGADKIPHENGVSCIEAGDAGSQSMAHNVLLVIILIIAFIGIIVGIGYLLPIKRMVSFSRSEKRLLADMEADDFSPEVNDGLWNVSVGTKKYGSYYEEQ